MVGFRKVEKEYGVADINPGLVNELEVGQAEFIHHSGRLAKRTSLVFRNAACGM